MDKYCSYCGGVEETTDHLLCGCRAACTLTDLVFRWYGIQHSNFSYTSEVLEFVYNWGSCLNRRRMLIGICYGMLWCIWRARNDRVFNNIKTFPERVVDIIKSIVYLWFKHRRKNGVCNWIDWPVCPFSCI